jgi:hypothetical protein
MHESDALDFPSLLAWCEQRFTTSMLSAVSASTAPTTPTFVARTGANPNCPGGYIELFSLVGIT